jgi:hypothetical protein
MNTVQYTATEIQAMVRKMDESKKKHACLPAEEYLQKLIEENEILHFNYPSIFSLHAEDKLDATFFYMLSQKRRVEKGELTEDDASKEVGNRLYRRWVEPVITQSAKPTEVSYEDYYKNLKNK